MGESLVVCVLRIVTINVVARQIPHTTRLPSANDAAKKIAMNNQSMNSLGDRSNVHTSPRRASTVKYDPTLIANGQWEDLSRFGWQSMSDMFVFVFVTAKLHKNVIACSSLDSFKDAVSGILLSGQYCPMGSTERVSRKSS